MVGAQETDPVLDDVQHATAKGIALLLSLGTQQAQDQILFLEPAVARNLHRFGKLTQFAERFGF